VWATIPDGPSLRPETHDARTRAVRERLAAEPDQPGPGPGAADPRLVDAALIEALRRYQLRHGLEADGILGRRTRTVLNEPLAHRIRQLIANLERWRWLPRSFETDHIAVNAAAATLSHAVGGAIPYSARVIVGDAKNPTPVLRAEVNSLVLNPSWYIPPSIGVNEVIPELRGNPRYLAERGIVVRELAGTDPFGLNVDWWAPGARRLARRLVQRPGEQNPLGRLKFDLPNAFAVYLHDTPAQQLFALTPRALSHGCVRVEGARDLARRVLDDERASALDSLIETGRTRRLTIDPPLPVYLVYFTAFVEAAGETNFRDDIYGRDARLIDALAHRPRP